MKFFKNIESKELLQKLMPYANEKITVFGDASNGFVIRGKLIDFYVNRSKGYPSLFLTIIPERCRKPKIYSIFSNFSIFKGYEDFYFGYIVPYEWAKYSFRKENSTGNMILMYSEFDSEYYKSHLVYEDYVIGKGYCVDEGFGSHKNFKTIGDARAYVDEITSGVKASA